MKTTRLEAFSDGVIAIILTIMVLELKVPHDTDPAALVAKWPIFMSYVLSFLIVAIYWVNHHHLVHLASKVDGPTLWWNLHLLFWMSLIPFATAYMGENHLMPFAVALYGFVALCCGWGFSLLRQAIARQQREDPKLAQLHRRLGRKNYLGLAIYAISVPAAFVNVWLSLVLIATPAVMYFFPDRQAEEHVAGK
jgi:uncharacterized membrane protein